MILTRRSLLRGFSIPAATIAGRAVASSPDVDLQLVLAVDASGSVNQYRFELQRHGFAQAFRNSQVLQAIQTGMTRSIAVSMVQWTGPRLHVEALPWSVVSDRESAETVATAIDAAPRKLFGGGTSLSGAIDYAMSMLAACPNPSPRRVIDISGDGSNNSGRPSAQARDEAIGQGVTINGLPILTVEPDLDSFYRDNVIGGEGAFLIAIKSFEDFGEAIVKKLVSEISFLGSPNGKRAG